MLPVNPPNNLTEGLSNFVAMIYNQLEQGNVEEAKLQLIDLYNDVGSAYVCQEEPEEKMSPVPDYDKELDGDYSSWLVRNNID
jgi:hypothetical protein